MAIHGSGHHATRQQAGMVARRVAGTLHTPTKIALPQHQRSHAAVRAREQRVSAGSSTGAPGGARRSRAQARGADEGAGERDVLGRHGRRVLLPGPPDRRLSQAGAGGKSPANAGGAEAASGAKPAEAAEAASEADILVGAA
eukprot:CAMPEP_0170203848 /NCGR_PEP_ID=MMETSP0116_2-20130129/1437_1 /TAXON_ID=400756 /ORGANISM="Durinskia baltica, Strain CSIRO CS-38" /LENGTH=141 /DNA_ID=CAMNT_0010454177 /DNA_START=94 /DNA_END=515 /DNA_ORIENTATION=+